MSEQEITAPNLDLATLHNIVDAQDHFVIWNNEFLRKKLIDSVSIDGFNESSLAAIIDELQREVQVPDDITSLSPDFRVIFDSFKTMQKKYVHVSLFASLSYVYIKDMLDQLQVTVDANKQRVVQAAQQASSVLKEQLGAEAKKYSELQQLLQKRAQGLNQFITEYSNTLATEAKGGSKRKKRAQKGGFIRDGTRANLAGDPYPKAS